VEKLTAARKEMGIESHEETLPPPIHLKMSEEDELARLKLQ
jgi:hypothetical protein